MTTKTAIICATIWALNHPILPAQDGPDTGPLPDNTSPELSEGGLPDLPPPPPAPDLGANAPADLNLPADGLGTTVADTPPAAADDLPAVPAEQPVPAVEPVDTPVDPVQPAAEEQIQESDEGYLIKDAALNDIFQFLAKQAGRQYFHNIKISTPEFRVTGHLNDGDPLQQMEELAFMYGLMLYTKGNTVYALTQSQLSQLPSSEFNYQLRYLRPSDIEQIKALIQPMLSPGTGIVNFEPKTNTIVIIDTAHHIEQARSLLHNIDKPKGQIIVETKILRIRSSASEAYGVDWSASLGAGSGNGTTLELSRSLNSIFGIGDELTTIPNGASGIDYDFDPTANLVLSPVQVSGVLRALAAGGVAEQVSNPTLITEDNEQGTISVIDRVPIITTTNNQGSSGDILQSTEEVRYKIDPSDQSITEDPENHREIGISMVVTPTLLPDGTIRMRLRPRSAQIVEYIETSQNRYPRVSESMIQSLSRVPDGHSLVIGGFYGEVETNDDNKVPLLGDIPVINFFFKSKETVKEQSSLVFIVTPTSYNPGSRSATGLQSNRIQGSLQLPRDHDWVDPTCNPGPAHEPNLRRGLRGLRPTQAPYYPTQEELDNAQRAKRVNQPTSTSAGAESSEPSRPRFSSARRR